ncbi:MAG: VOC family protein [Actinobacteria bacterium]|uniref:Unannotated protein n=1 Tax=freshwater metagenome TaxID=449393 RepID=A0A6J5ZIV4_9ZZZZ|nr:VOC family protein [Actinomycetota bacterium]
MNPITTCLWFNGTARQAATFYTQIFPNSHVEGGTKSPADNPSVSEGEELMVSFTLNGMPFVGLNGGPHFQFNEAVSFMISTDGQDETDRYWEAMTADGGAPGQCGWLKDQFGVSWQVVPQQMGAYLGGPDADGARRAMEAMLEMSKIDIQALKEAYEG